LKQAVVKREFVEACLSALDPGKQGLKPLVSYASGGRGWLSALDPGKRGLKLIAQE